jgi:hypothetical protein
LEIGNGMAIVGGENVPFREGSFDILILHRILEELPEMWRGPGLASHVSGFVSRASRVLVSGGLVAGCVTNRFSLAYNLNRLGASFRRLRRHAASPARCSFSRSFLKGVLERAGLTDIELFWLFPDDQSPTLLFEDDRSSAKALWLRDLSRRRHKMARWRFLAERLVLELGPLNLRCESIFFWGRKN